MTHDDERQWIKVRERSLPRWAQAIIGGLRRALADEQQRADEARLATSPQDSDTLIESHDQVSIGLGMGTMVRFVLGPHPRQYIDVRVRGNEIQVMGGDTIAVLPQSGNVVRVSVVEP